MALLCPWLGLRHGVGSLEPNRFTAADLGRSLRSTTPTVPLVSNAALVAMTVVLWQQRLFFSLQAGGSLRHVHDTVFLAAEARRRFLGCPCGPRRWYWGRDLLHPTSYPVCLALPFAKHVWLIAAAVAF